MSNDTFLPEGALIHTARNTKLTSSADGFIFAMENECVIEGMTVLCDSEHNLTVDFGGIRGVIPHSEAALGIADGTTREIAVISRVGKPSACIVKGVETSDGHISLLLSRADAQRLALRFLIENSSPGDIIPAKITHLENFGAFCDIGCGNVSLIGIENISVSRISHPRDRFRTGDFIHAVISGFDFEKQRVLLSHRELLGTWEENAAAFCAGETVRGIVRGVEEYGVFIELAPNLSGLAEPRNDLAAGDLVSVFIKNIVPEKMKIKLIIIDKLAKHENSTVSEEDYFITDGHIDSWEYSPTSCTSKKIISFFGDEQTAANV